MINGWSLEIAQNNAFPLLGVDFGGTKIEAALIGRDGSVLERRRAPNPGNYDAAIATVRELVTGIQTHAGQPAGFAIPGSPSPETGLIRNANSTWLNGKSLNRDLETALARNVKIANDANCFALSEARGGAAQGHDSVFGVILGTGCGGGLVHQGRLIEGAHGIAGEWGHIPLPAPGSDDRPDRACWCGRENCLETYLSGPAVSVDYRLLGGRAMAAHEIADRAAAGERRAVNTLDRLVSRLGRALGLIVNVFDPSAIVLGGGLSNIDRLYGDLPGAIRPHVFSDMFETPVLRHKHGDSSGVRGAAWLWSE